MRYYLIALEWRKNTIRVLMKLKMLSEYNFHTMQMFIMASFVITRNWKHLKGYFTLQPQRVVLNSISMPLKFFHWCLGDWIPRGLETRVGNFFENYFFLNSCDFFFLLQDEYIHAFNYKLILKLCTNLLFTSKSLNYFIF